MNGQESPDETAAAKRWQALRAAFEHAVTLAASEREAYVRERVVAGDLDALAQAELLAMLAADQTHPSHPSGLGTMAPDLLRDLDAEEMARERELMRGRRFGAWTLAEEIGRGGMGAVWRAERHTGDFRQQGALKLIRSGWDSLDLRRRFRAERRILAGLQHPHIAAMLDGGETDSGQPWLVMEYVQGQGLLEHCASLRLDVPARLKLFLSVCEAVAYAHRSLVVHRDLKPSNILVDGDGRVKLLDFGIAKLLEPGNDLTGTGQRLFTPEYAAPEQVRGEAVTTSVDVHALGLLLYTLLTGLRPWGQRASTPAAYEHAILSEEPTRPSQALRAEGEGSAPTPDRARLAAQLKGDLDAIVMKALRKESNERYATVAELAEDVRRHLRREPVLARRGNLRYRMRRFVERHALASAMAGLAVLSLITGLGLALWQAGVAEAARQTAEREARIAGAVADFMTEAFAQADPDNAGVPDPSARHVLDQGAQALAAQRDLDAATRAALMVAIGRAYVGLRETSKGRLLLDEAAPLLATDGGLRTRIEWHLALATAINNQKDLDGALAQLESADRELLAAGDPLPLLRARVDGLTGLVLNNLRRYEDALPKLESARRALLEQFGPASEELSDIISVHVSVLNGLGRETEATAMAEAAYRAARETPAIRPLLLGRFANGYGLALLRVQRYEEAEAVFAESLAIDEALYGTDSERIGPALNNLAVALLRQRRFDAATALFLRQREILMLHRSEDSVQIARAELNLGLAELQAGRQAEAVSWLQAGLARWNRDGSPWTDRYMSGLLGLVRAHELAGDLAAAEITMREVEPFLSGELSTQGRAYRALALVIRARLADRRGAPDPSCATTAELLALPNLDPQHALEGRILHAQCERARGADPEPTLAGIDPADPLLEKVNPHTRAVLEDLRQSDP
jgi:eukaryotic-like serine/threonine-protein kinase